MIKIFPAGQLCRRCFGRLEQRAVGRQGDLAGVGVPGFGQLFVIFAEIFLESLLHAAGLHRILEEIADHRFAVLRADIMEYRLAQTVDPDITGAIELVDAQQFVVFQSIAHPHSGGIVEIDREIFRHPLNEPQRGIEAAVAALLGEDDVVLKGMHQLVHQHVVKLPVGAGHGQDHPLLEAFRHPAGAAADHALHRVGLLEVVHRSVQDQRDTLFDLMIEHLAQVGITPLGHAGGVAGGSFHFRIVVHVEVLGAEDLPVEIFVLNFILPELEAGLGPERR